MPLVRPSQFLTEKILDMKTFNSLLTFTLLLLFGSNAFAQEKPFTIELIDRLAKVTASAKDLSDKYPELDNEIGIETVSKGGKALADALKKSKAYDDINKITKANGFNSIEEMTEYQFRFWSAQAAVGLEQMPHDVSEEQMQQIFALNSKMIAEQKEAMLKMGMSEAEVKAKIEKSTKSMEESMKSIKYAKMAAKSAKPADVAFVKANQPYIEKLMDPDSQADSID